MARPPLDWRRARVQLERKRQAVRERKRRPCADCRRRRPPGEMSFDHCSVYPKRFDISTAMRNPRISLWVLIGEMDLCDVVCARCHTAREVRRGRFPAGWTGLTRQAGASA
jgi:hypothetical protein